MDVSVLDNHFVDNLMLHVLQLFLILNNFLNMFDNMNVNIMLNVQIVQMNNHDNIINMFQVNDHLNLLLLLKVLY